MAEAVVEIRRCEHIKTNGTQCGSPALREKKFCYFHQQCRTTVVRMDPSQQDTSAVEFVLPALEDANAIQLVVRQVTELILRDKIDAKKAGQVLYAMQIAAANLKQINEEKPRPTQVVVDPETVGETPVGQTPWSRTGEGHDPDDTTDAVEKAVKEANESWAAKYSERKKWMERQAQYIDEYLRPGQELKLERAKEIMGSVRHDLNWVVMSMCKDLPGRFQ